MKAPEEYIAERIRRKPDRKHIYKSLNSFYELVKRGMEISHEDPCDINRKKLAQVSRRCKKIQSQLFEYTANDLSLMFDRIIQVINEIYGNLAEIREHALKQADQDLKELKAYLKKYKVI